jgi:hypothetical protein
MKKSKLSVVALVTLLLAGVFALPVLAQSPVTAEVDRTRLSTDEALLLKISIDSSAGQATQPVLPALDGFELLGSSSGTQISIINGDMNMQATYSYSLHPIQIGQLVINPIEVQIDGQVYSTQPIMIEVSQGTGQAQPAPNQGIPSMPGFPTRPNFPTIPGFPNLNNLFPSMPGAPVNPVNPTSPAAPMDPADVPNELVGQPFFVEAEVDNPNPYQGEQVLYTFRFYQAENLYDQPEYQSPSFTGFWSEERGEDQVDYTTEAAGRPYRVTELPTVLFPTGVGEVTIDPAVLSIPGDFFSRGTVLQTQPINMNVRPLPDNAPANFQGAVGQFEIQAQTDTVETKVNETVTLQVALRGRGNMNNLADPQWTEGPEWRAFDSEATVNTQFVDGALGGVRSYERLLVPTQAGDLLLPAIEFSYFNPQTESYETTSSEAILVNVIGDVAADVIPATPNGGAGATVNAAVTVAAVPELRPNKPASELGHSSGAALTGSASYWLLWALPLLLIAGHFGWSLYRQQRLDTVDERRSQGAAKKAKQSLRAALKQQTSRADEIAGQVLTSYLEEKLNHPMTGQTQTQLNTTLLQKGIDPELAERVQNCLMLSEMGRYAPVGINSANGDLLSETEQVINDLEKVL